MRSGESHVLLIGAAGQLGRDIATSPKSRRIRLTCADRNALDITDAAAVSSAIAASRADVVINAASFTNVDRCEEEPRQAMAVNAEGAREVARACVAADARAVYISTDYVFDGRKEPPAQYREDDETGPLNEYGRSKLAGEQFVAATDPHALIVRVSSLFGAAGARGKGGNFVEAILTRAKSSQPIVVVADQYMTPTYTRDAANAILELVAMGTTGIVHVSNTGATTWFDFARAIVSAVGLEVEVRPTTAAEYGARARRPANSALSTDRLQTILGRELRPWPQALHAYLVEKGHLQVGRDARRGPS
jgi:dTDP-4-dehydrorhamnose reductase